MFNQSWISLNKQDKSQMESQNHLNLGFKSNKEFDSDKRNLFMMKKKKNESQIQLGNRSNDTSNDNSKTRMLSIMTPNQIDGINLFEKSKSMYNSSSSFKLFSVKKINIIVKQNENLVEPTPKQAQGLTNKISQYLKLCNIKQIDHQNELQKERVVKIMKKQKYDSMTQMLRDTIRSPLSRSGSSKETINEINHHFLNFRLKLPTKNFTLKHIDQINQQSSSEQISLLNNRVVMNMIINRPQNKQIRQYRQKNGSLNLMDGSLQLAKQPDYTRYIINQPVVKKEATLNFKELINNHKKNNQIKIENDDIIQIDIIKKQNQIKVLNGNTKQVKQMQAISGEVINQIKQQNQKADQYVQVFVKQLEL